MLADQTTTGTWMAAPDGQISPPGFTELPDGTFLLGTGPVTELPDTLDDLPDPAPFVPVTPPPPPPGPWETATAQILAGLRGKPDPDAEVLPEPEHPDRAERWARALVADNPDRDLRLALPAVWAVACAASEGAYWTRMPGENLAVPLVVQFVGLADTGFGKSSLLGRLEPLAKLAVTAAVEQRLSWRAEMLAKLQAGNKDLDEHAVNALLAQAVCPATFTHSGTPEGLRDNLVVGGGHRAIVTDEVDAIREMSSYAKDSGSVTVLVRGWDRGDYAVDRAGRGGKVDLIAVEQITLPILQLIQPAAFAEHTAASSWESKGVLGRWLVMPGRDVPVPDHYVPPIAAESAPGQLVPAADVELAGGMEALAVRGAVFRGEKALRRAVLAARVRGEQTAGVETLVAGGVPVGVVLGWDSAGIAAHHRVQQLRLDVLRAMHEARAPKDGAAWSFAQRLTSHVHRIAMVRTLMDDPGATLMSAVAVQDTALRLLPWLVAGWGVVMAERADQVGRDAVAESLERNPLGRARTPEALLFDRMTYRDDAGVLRARLCRRGRLLDSIGAAGGRKERRTLVRRAAARVLDDWVAKGWVRASGSGGKNAAGVESMVYRLTPGGIGMADPGDQDRNQ